MYHNGPLVLLDLHINRHDLQNTTRLKHNDKANACYGNAGDQNNDLK